MALYKNANLHYVKFMRGSPSAWETLLTMPDKISDDTLYFIYESIDNPTEGKLYLGQKLISGSTNINDIGDIYIDDSYLADNQILVYNEANQQWENKPLSDIINTAVGIFSGTDGIGDGTSGLVPVPKVGDQNKFLRGDGTWATINFPNFDQNIFQVVNSNIITLNGIAQAPVGTIPVKNASGGITWANVTAGLLSRQIITMSDLQTAMENGTTSENIIYMVLVQDSEEENHYNEYMVVSGKLELIGTITHDVDLSDYITTSIFQNAIGNLQDILYDKEDQGITTQGLISKVSFLETKVGNLNNLQLSPGNETLVEEINTINDQLDELTGRMQWHELNNQT